MEAVLHFPSLSYAYMAMDNNLFVKKRYHSPYTKQSLPGKNRFERNCCFADFHGNVAIDLNNMGISS